MGTKGGGFTDEQYLKIREISRIEGESGDFGAQDILSSAIQIDPSIQYWRSAGRA